MEPFLISRDFEIATFPDIARATEQGAHLQKNETDSHFYFHFQITNPSEVRRTVHVTCQWPLGEQRYGLFPELCRAGQEWERIEVTYENASDPSKAGKADFSFALDPRESVYLANTPCMSYPEMRERLSALARAKPQMCRLVSVGTSPKGNEVPALRFAGADARPKLVVMGTSQAPEYGERMACGVADWLAGDDAAAVELREAFHIDVIPMAHPDIKREGSKAYRPLFDFGQAAAGAPDAPAHAATIWRYLVQDPPEFLMELHSETRTKKGAEGYRIYAVDAGVHQSAARGERSQQLVQVLMGRIDDVAVTPMHKDSQWADTLMYQAPHRLDTFAIGFACHIRHGVRANLGIVTKALAAWATT